MFGISANALDRLKDALAKTDQGTLFGRGDNPAEGMCYRFFITDHGGKLRPDSIFSDDVLFRYDDELVIAMDRILAKTYDGSVVEYDEHGSAFYVTHDLESPTRWAAAEIDS